MAFQFPKGLPELPTELPKGLPKVSDFTTMLSTPEKQFESMARTSLRFDLPPGPLTTLLKFQKGLEAGKPELPKLPEAPKVEQVLARLPKLPGLPGQGGGGGGEVPTPSLVKNLTPGYAKEPKAELVRFRLTK